MHATRALVVPLDHVPPDLARLVVAAGGCLLIEGVGHALGAISIVAGLAMVAFVLLRAGRGVVR